MLCHKNILTGIKFAILLVLLGFSIRLVLSQAATGATGSTDENTQLIAACKQQGLLGLAEGQQPTAKELQDCLVQLLEKGTKDKAILGSFNFNSVGSDLFSDSKVSDAILGNQDLLSKYNTEILEGKFILDKSGDVSGAMFSKEGTLKLANGNEYDLKSIKGKQVTIQQDRIVIDAAGADIADFKGIMKGNDYFELKEGTFKLGGESFELSGKAYVDSDGNIFLPAGSKVSFKGFTIENPIAAVPEGGEAKQADWVHVSPFGKSASPNSVSWDSSGNIYSSSSKNGKVLVYDSKNDLGALNEGGASSVFYNSINGYYKVSASGYIFMELRASDGSPMTYLSMPEVGGTTLISTKSPRWLSYSNINDMAVLSLNSEVATENIKWIGDLPESLKNGNVVATDGVDVKSLSLPSEEYQNRFKELIGTQNYFEKYSKNPPNGLTQTELAALLAAIAQKESSMGHPNGGNFNDNLLLGYDDPRGGGKAGFSGTENQIRGASDALRKAFNNENPKYSVCYGFSGEEKMNCILSIYNQGEINVQGSAYAKDVISFFNQWKNYL